MARHTDRKLFLFGRYSLALLLPKTWLRELGVTAGSQVHLEFDRARKRIVVRLHATEPIVSSTTVKKNSKAPEADWTPLPEL